MVKEPSEISDISNGVVGEEGAKLVRLLSSAILLVVGLVPAESAVGTAIGRVSARSLGLAASAAVQAVNALMAAAGFKCNLALPPEDVDMKVADDGAVVYRCYHSPAHEWDLSGNRRP